MESEDLIALQLAMMSYYAEFDGIPEYIMKLEKACIILLCGNLTMSDQQLLNIASASIFASQDFLEATREWERLTSAAKLLTPIARGGGDIVTANVATPTRHGIPPTTTKPIDVYLDNLANAATQDTQQLSLLVG